MRSKLSTLTNNSKYQCHCSLLEIYNEQITDLLDPNQRNLQIREDVRTGIYVENLREECVYTMKDVTQLLIKGLSNRRTGETSINAESSRSHTVFTCVVKSRCKSMEDGVSSFKSSRINLVDLAGSEWQKLTGAAGERLKEAGNINRSPSQLGHTWSQVQVNGRKEKKTSNLNFGMQTRGVCPDLVSHGLGWTTYMKFYWKRVIGSNLDLTLATIY